MVLDGLCLTMKNKRAYLWNFVEGSPESFENDIGVLNYILEQILGGVTDENTSKRLKRFNDLLKELKDGSTKEYKFNDVCKNRKKLVTEFILIHHVFWDEDESQKFLANIHRLAKGHDCKLTENGDFRARLAFTLLKWVKTVQQHPVLKGAFDWWMKICSYLHQTSL